MRREEEKQQYLGVKINSSSKHNKTQSDIVKHKFNITVLCYLHHTIQLENKGNITANPPRNDKINANSILAA